jgi:hypothetical protein
VADKPSEEPGASSGARRETAGQSARNVPHLALKSVPNEDFVSPSIVKLTNW